MGYETQYTLSIHSSENEDEKFMADLALSEDDDLSSFYKGYGDRCKWYSHEDELRGFSKNYPQTTFLLEGVGEEFPDIWRKYFRDGKMQKVRAELVYKPFDQTRLA